jgi:threonine-phosphate decarboxylase
MNQGHGDDAYQYGAITSNFSSNIYNKVNHAGLYAHLAETMPAIAHYPEPEPYTLQRALARHLRLDDPACVMVTNGATEAIYLLAQAFAESASAVYMPTFSEYADACRLHRHRVLPFYRMDDLPSEARLVWICNPNNPTGEVHDKAQLTELIQRRPQTLFILDQSYEPFTLKALFTAREALRLPNVVLIHSFTKQFAIPGLRLGYLTAPAELLRQVSAQRMPWSVNQVAIEAGLYLLQHEADFALDLSALLSEKDRVSQALQALGCVEVWPSDTHYLLARLRMGRADALKQYLATEHGILIRDASNFQGLDAGFFRIAVQTPAENDQLIKAIESWIVSM